MDPNYKKVQGATTKSNLNNQRKKFSKGSV